MYIRGQKSAKESLIKSRRPLERWRGPLSLETKKNEDIVEPGKKRYKQRDGSKIKWKGGGEKRNSGRQVQDSPRGGWRSWCASFSLQRQDVCRVVCARSKGPPGECKRAGKRASSSSLSLAPSRETDAADAAEIPRTRITRGLTYVMHAYYIHAALSASAARSLFSLRLSLSLPRSSFLPLRLCTGEADSSTPCVWGALLRQRESQL